MSPIHVANELVKAKKDNWFRKNEMEDLKINPTSIEGDIETKIISMDDYKLWKDFKSGDRAAYAAIYRKYFFELFNYGRKIVDDKELIKDNIQDLFIKIWNNRENLSNTTSVRYYLFTSLKYKLIDTLRSAEQRLKVSNDVTDYDFAEALLNDDEDLHAQKAKVLKTISKLSKHQQKVLHMKFFKNQSNKEIADELGITVQSVYNSVFKTLKIIRKQLLSLLLLFWFI